MQERDFQVCICFNGDLKGQLMQVSYSEYLRYWKLIGWQLTQKAPEFPFMPARTKPAILQTELM